VLVSQILIAPGVPRSVKLHVTLWESLTAPPRSLLLTRGIGGRIVFPGPLPEQDVAVLVTDIQRSEDRADAARLLVSAPECVRIYRPEHPMNKESQ
jgi:sRNA-binding carbon storage regulator CsrA